MAVGLNKRIGVSVEFPQAVADSMMDRFMELEGVLNAEFRGEVSSAPVGDLVSRVILIVPRDMSERLVVRIVRMVLEEHGLPPETGKPTRVTYTEKETTNRS